MIKKFYIFENTLYSYLKKSNEEQLHDLVGLDSKNYELTTNWNINHITGFELSFKYEFIEDLLDLDEGTFRWIFSVLSSYSSNYELYVDDSELDYMIYFLSDENTSKLEKVLKFLDVSDAIENQQICYIFDILGDNLIDYREIIYEISAAREVVVRKDVNKVINELPVSLENAYNEWDMDVIFDIDEIGEYIEKNKLEDINTVSDFLENIDFSNINYELENTNESEFDTDYTDTNKEFGKQLDSLIEKMDITEEKYNDINQLKLFKEDEKKSEYKFDFGFFGKIKINNNNIYKIKNVGGKLLGWIKSYPFQKNYMKGNDLKNYKFLEEHEIIHSKIVDEYEYLDAATKYNL